MNDLEKAISIIQALGPQAEKVMQYVSPDTAALVSTETSNRSVSVTMDLYNEVESKVNEMIAHEKPVVSETESMAKAMFDKFQSESDQMIAFMGMRMEAQAKDAFLALFSTERQETINGCHVNDNPMASSVYDCLAKGVKDGS